MSSSIRVLLDCIYTNKSIARCATWYVLRAVGERILNEFPNAVLYIPIPNTTDTAWEVDEVWKDDRVIYFPMTMYRDRYKEYLTLKDKWVENFAFWGNAFDWDVLVTTRAYQVANIRSLTYKGYQKFISIYEPLPLIKGKKTVTLFHDYRELQLQTLNGYINADRVAIHAGHEVDSIMQEAMALLSPAMCRQLQQKIVQKYMAPSGVDLSFPYSKEKREPGLPLNVVYTQRLDKSERRPDKVFDAFRYAFIVEGSKYTFGLMTNGTITDIDKDTDKFKKFVEYDQPTREVFYQKLRKAHVCASWAIEEGVPFSLVEAISHGVIPVVKKERWSKALFGDNYPWFVHTTKEAVAMIKYIEENYELVYQEFLHWYENFWMPKCKREGDFIDDLITQLKTQFLPKRMKEAVKHDKNGSLAKTIHDYCMKNTITKFNMHTLLKKMGEEGVTRQDFGYVLENVDLFNVPIARCTSLYETRCELLEIYGWKDWPEVGGLYYPVAV